MNAEQFLEIIKQGNQLSKEQVNQLVKLHENFPYFQIPNVLLAKYEYQKSKGKAKDFLPWAAISSPNRAWLKVLLGEKLIFPVSSPNTPSSDKKIQAEKEDGEDEAELIPKPSPEENPTQRAGLLKKLGEELTSKQKEVKEETEKLKKPKRKKRAGAADDLIETIKRKEKKEIVDVKKKEQIDIIKAFSKKEIKLATIKEIESVQKQEDLSEKSTQLNPNILSESFAKLLIKQGKKGKAKEIYQKLMVKFPNKSTYFADLIKELED
ncbi:hypothetical protein [Belliella pelovolcani]|uniref:Tetratricopeptide repeat-containing protein n=1 Tax=Belliella pelovolcani TaxID=529505 RepID=A0A1N7LEQ3_9BACT|nr:hypothetical protein [Belliella pelovolcani]SIS72298.1 hypothetical protein SAMN05421761_103275 [Belliella pelovolcani]